MVELQTVDAVVVVPGQIVQPPAIERAKRAAQYGEYDELLLALGDVHVDEADGEGCSLMQWAAINGRTRIVKLLLERGADTDFHGGVLDETALQWAVRQGHLAVVVALREAGCNVAHTGVEGANAVHIACRHARIEPLVYLLARDESSSNKGLLELLDEKGKTPLMVAVEWFWTAPDRAIEVIRLLVGLGASVNYAETTSGLTALHLASERGLAPQALLTLVRAGAALSAEDDEGRTAEKIAMENKHAETVYSLRKLKIEEDAMSTRACVASKLTSCCSSPKRKHSVTNPPSDDDVEAAALMDSDVNTKRREPPSTNCFARLYGGISPVVVMLLVGLSAPRIEEDKLGWAVPLVALVVILTAFAMAPYGSGEATYCGFAAGSIALIVGSFFLFGFHLLVSTLYLLLYVAVVALLSVSFAAAVITDPGTVEATRPEKIAKLVELARSGRLSESRLCCTCLIERPLRSKHDPVRWQRCVRRFDHYCPYIANVVGLKNYKYFYCFLAAVVVAISLQLKIVIPRVTFACFRDSGKMCLRRPDNALLLAGTFLAVLHLFWVAMMFGMHSTLVCHDRTTYESMRVAHLHQPTTHELCCQGLAKRNAQNALCPADDDDDNGHKDSDAPPQKAESIVV